MRKRDRSGPLDRRLFVKLAGAGGAAIAAAACGHRDEPERSRASAVPGEAASAGAHTAVGADRAVVRVASVPTAVEGNVLPALIADFERSSRYRVELTTSPQLYGLARAGKVDLLVSHYGHRDAEQFVMDGLGEWPRTVFSNQMALIGPPGDPARVRGVHDAGEAFRAIAASRSPFVLNDSDGVHYLTEILWHAAGRPERAGWFLDLRTSGEAAIEKASQLGAYSLWGLTPFLRLRKAKELRLEPLVLADPLLQRMLVTIIVKPGGARDINTIGAAALQAHLLTPAVQAQIRTIRYPGVDVVTWVPAGRHNRTAILPKA
jgi:tungstate transport system substrate-binding protein